MALPGRPTGSAWNLSKPIGTSKFACGNSVPCGLESCPQPDCGESPRINKICRVCGKQVEAGRNLICEIHEKLFASYLKENKYEGDHWGKGWIFYHWVAIERARFQYGCAGCPHRDNYPRDAKCSPVPTWDLVQCGRCKATVCDGRTNAFFKAYIHICPTCREYLNTHPDPEHPYLVDGTPGAPTFKHATCGDHDWCKANCNMGLTPATCGTCHQAMCYGLAYGSGGFNDPHQCQMCYLANQAAETLGAVARSYSQDPLTLMAILQVLNTATKASPAPAPKPAPAASKDVSQDIVRYCEKCGEPILSVKEMVARHAAELDKLDSDHAAEVSKLRDEISALQLKEGGAHNKAIRLEGEVDSLQKRLAEDESIIKAQATDNQEMANLRSALNKLRGKSIPWRCRLCYRRAGESLEHWPCPLYKDGGCTSQCQSCRRNSWFRECDGNCAVGKHEPKDPSIRVLQKRVRARKRQEARDLARKVAAARRMARQLNSIYALLGPFRFGDFYYRARDHLQYFPSSQDIFGEGKDFGITEWLWNQHAGEILPALRAFLEREGEPKA